MLANTWMSLEGIALSEMSQTEKDKHCVVSPTHGTWREKCRVKFEKQREEQWLPGAGSMRNRSGQ